MNCKKCAAPLPEGAVYCPMCGRKQLVQQKKHKKRANGTGTISKLPGNRSKPWVAQKAHMYIGSYKTYVEAQRALDRLVDTDITEKYNWTFSQIYEAWKPEHFRQISKSQQGSYHSAYKNCTELHDRKFRSLRKSDFQGVIMRLEDDGLSKSSCEKVMQLFGQLSKWALDECIIVTNHAANVSTVAENKKQQIPYTNEEIAAIAKSELPAAQVMQILLATGCRPNELFKAQTSDCYDNYFISGSKTDAGKDRVIAVSAYGLAAYTHMLAQAREKNCKSLIGGYQGNKQYTNWVKRDYDALSTAIGLEGKTPYAARHTYITNAIRSGVPANILRRQVGHADITTTDKHYTHMDKDDILAAAEKVVIGK